MMNETTITGKSWTRANKVIVNNPSPNELLSIQFFEEIYTEMSNGLTNVVPGDVVEIPVIDPAMEVVCVHPDTLEPTGQTITVAQMCTAIVGLWKVTTKQSV